MRGLGFKIEAARSGKLPKIGFLGARAGRTLPLRFCAGWANSAGSKGRNILVEFRWNIDAARKSPHIDTWREGSGQYRLVLFPRPFTPPLSSA